MSAVLRVQCIQTHSHTHTQVYTHACICAHCNHLCMEVLCVYMCGCMPCVCVYVRVSVLCDWGHTCTDRHVTSVLRVRYSVRVRTSSVECFVPPAFSHPANSVSCCRSSLSTCTSQYLLASGAWGWLAVTAVGKLCAPSALGQT